MRDGSVPIHGFSFSVSTFLHPMLNLPAFCLLPDIPNKTMISLDKKLFTARSTIFRQAAAGITALVYEDLKAQADPEPSHYKTTTYDPALIAMFKNKQSNRSRWLGALGCLASIVLVVNWLWNRR
jgi:hypothetical protein